MRKSTREKPGQTRTPLKVRDVMTTDVVTFRDYDTLTLLHDVMGLARIRHFPVVDDEDRPVGILSQRDLYRAALSHRLGEGTPEQRAHLNTLTVRDEMSTPVVTAEQDDDLSKCLREMAERRVGALVVVEKGKLAGLVTETDLLVVLADILEGK